MKKMISLVALSSALISTSLMAEARETKFFPVADGKYCPAPGVALVGGVQTIDSTDTSPGVYGVEVSLACPILQLSTNDIRQQVSVLFASEDGLDTITIEANPHVMFDVAPNLQVGFGPGFGVIFADADGLDNDTAFGVNVGVSMNYNINRDVFVGAEYRYQWTTDVDFGTDVEDDLDNQKAILKVGMHF